MYLLDTNVISALRRPDRAPQVTSWLRGKPETSLYLSGITLGEIEHGIRAQERQNPPFAADLRTWMDRTIRLYSDRLPPFEDARIWVRLSQDIGHGGADLMIAATALVHSATVVTGNLDDFLPTGVSLENHF